MTQETTEQKLQEITPETMQQLTADFCLEIIRMAQSIPAEANEMAITNEVQVRLLDHIQVAYAEGYKQGIRDMKETRGE